MTGCNAVQGFLDRDEVMDEHFPYVARGTSGEYIIPADRIHDFILKFQELSDRNDHLEHLKLYRQEGRRFEDGEIDD